MEANTIEVLEAQVVRFRVDTRSLSGKAVKSSNAIVSVVVRDSLGKVSRGHGEVQIRPGATGDETPGYISILSTAVERLAGGTVDVTSSRSAVESIATLTAGAIEGGIAESDDDRVLNLPRPSSGVTFGIEAALFDAVSGALERDVAEMLSGAEVEPREVPFRGMLRPASLIRGDAVSTLLSDPVFNADEATVWIDFGRRLTVNGTLRWVERVCALLTATDSTPRLNLLRPLKKEEEADYDDLVQGLDGVLPQSMTDRVQIVQEVDDARFVPSPILASSPRYGVAVRVTGAGGLVAADRLVGRLSEGPELEVHLVDNPGSSELSGVHLSWIAAAHPSVRSIASPNTWHAGVDRFDAGVTNELWAQILGIPTARLETSGSVFLHAAEETPNYYPEEKYLQPVGAIGSKARLLQKAALLAGFNTVQYSKSAFSIADADGKTLFVHGSATPLNSAAAKAICNHKETTRLILQREGIPVPQGRSFGSGDFETAGRYAKQLGFPVVVKPAMGTMGIGVKSGIQNPEELELAFAHFASSRLADQGFIVEKHVYGEEYRIIVIGDEVIAAVCREPASVIGDGVHTVAELVLRKNHFRRTNPQLGSSPIKYSSDTTHVLSEQNLTLGDVPEKDQRVPLSSSSNISQGGDSRELLDRLHPSIIEASIQAVKAVPGLNYCGVDFLLEDPSKPLDEQSAGICELNAQAATGTAEYPLYGTPRPVPQRAFEKCIEMFDLSASPPEDMSRVSLRLKIRGRVTGVGYRDWFVRWAREFSVVGTVRNTGPRAVEVELMGESLAVAALSAAAISGPSRAKPTSVSSEHIGSLTATSFDKIVKSSQVPQARQSEREKTRAPLFQGTPLRARLRKVKKWIRQR